jgi:hypothetical protein
LKLLASSICIRFTPKPRPTYTDARHPYKLDAVGARSAQAFARSTQVLAKLARPEAVRADHRLRTDDEAIRAQSTIMG